MGTAMTRVASIAIAATLAAGCTADTGDSGTMDGAGASDDDVVATEPATAEDDLTAGPSPRATGPSRTATAPETGAPAEDTATEVRTGADTTAAPDSDGVGREVLRASGTGDGASASAEVSRGVVVVTLSGEGVRDVALVDADDRRIVRVDVRGDGTVALPVARDGVFRLAVGATGPWGLEARWHDRGRADLPIEVRGTGTDSTEVFPGGATVTVRLEARGGAAAVMLTTAEGTREILTVSDGVETVREELSPGPAVLTVRGRGNAPWRLAAK